MLSSGVLPEGAPGLGVQFLFGLIKGPEGSPGRSPGSVAVASRSLSSALSAPPQCPRQRGGIRQLGSLLSWLFLLGTFSKRSLST